MKHFENHTKIAKKSFLCQNENSASWVELKSFSLDGGMLSPQSPKTFKNCLWAIKVVGFWYSCVCSGISCNCFDVLHLCWGNYDVYHPKILTRWWMLLKIRCPRKIGLGKKITYLPKLNSLPETHFFLLSFCWLLKYTQINC